MDTVPDQRFKKKVGEAGRLPMNGMSISFGQAIERLLSGGKLSWLASGAARAGSITLAEPGQRRLFSYLLVDKT